MNAQAFFSTVISAVIFSLLVKKVHSYLPTNFVDLNKRDLYKSINLYVFCKSLLLEYLKFSL